MLTSWCRAFQELRTAVARAHTLADHPIAAADTNVRAISVAGLGGPWLIPWPRPGLLLCAQWRARHLEARLTMMGNVYGAYAPMRRRMDLQTVARAQRLPGLPSSRLGLEVLLNTLEDIDFDEVLTDARHTAEPVDLHLAMEQRLGMTPQSHPPSAVVAPAPVTLERAVART